LRIRELDFLRGIALICVICTHTIGYFPTKTNEINFFFGLGRYGVQLFFVISAFTMTMLAQHKIDFCIPNFYIKRFLRLFPLFLIAAIAYYPTQKMPNYWNPDGLQLWQFLISICFLQGFLPNTINTTVPGGWSISNEANFYLIFPFILKIVNSKYKFIFIILLSFLYFLLHPIIKQLFSAYPSYLIKNYFYLFLLNQINVFIYGMIIYNWIYKSEYSIRNDILFFILYFTLLLFISYIFNDYNHLITNLIGISFALILFLNLIFLKFKNKYIEKVGTVTYTGYILHFGILMLFEKLFDFNFLIALPLVILLTIIISLFLKPYTEDIWVKIGNKFINSKKH
jgi:exopolysaccharide production protein ExoZ